MAEAGVASRRACEQLIEAGEVEVNGELVASLPAWVDPEHDRITVRGKAIADKERPVYVMLYKPKGTLCTMDDPEERRTVADLVDHPAVSRLYPVGRLDYDTLGLLLMTNDGALANQLTHPRYGVEKTYRAIAKGTLGEEQVNELSEGMYIADRRDGRTLGGVRTAPIKLEIVRREPGRLHLDVTLKEGRNREVRRVLAKVGLSVKKLTRVKMGPLELKGLAVGEWRELSNAERNLLKRAVRVGTASSRRRRDRRGGPRGGRS